MTDSMNPQSQFQFDMAWGTDTAQFSSVSGLSNSIEMDQVTEGGENRFVHHLPGKKTPSNVVLERGLMPATSQCLQTQDLSTPVTTQTLALSLLDVNGAPVARWSFKDACVVRIKTQNTVPHDGSVLVEAIEFAYHSVTREA